MNKTLPKSSLIFSLIPLIAACTVSWDGYTPGREYQMSFVDDSGKPVSGVYAKCFGNGVWPSDAEASEINSQASHSGENGILKFSHDGHEDFGYHKEFGPFTWGHKPPDIVTCDFLHQDRVVHSSQLPWLDDSKSIVIKQ